MKQKLFLIPSLFILLFFQSCALLKEGNNSVATNNDNRKHHFLNGIAINSGSNSVSTTQNKSVYRIKDKENKAVSDKEITIDQVVATTDTALANFIRNWLGVPYQYGGATKGGIDCSAFTQALYAAVYHVSLLRTAFQQFSASTPIYDSANLKEGDLVFFKIGSRVISHVGVYLSDGYFVQASNHGVVISNLDENYWKRHFYAGGRIQD